VQATFTELTDQLQRIETTANRHLTDLSERVAATEQGDRRLTEALQLMLAATQEHTSALEALAALPARLSDVERSLS
jgi:uncharacterized phage infection (PIP) family protein YhgE